jgi:HSP20 family molecular chaperone IbpA
VAVGPGDRAIERRFDELIRSRWRVRGRVSADVLLHGDEMWVEVDVPGVDDWEIAEATGKAGVLRVRLRREAKS